MVATEGEFTEDGCPVVKADTARECPPPESIIGECLSNDDCPNGKRCCTVGCLTVCVKGRLEDPVQSKYYLVLNKVTRVTRVI